MKDERTKSIRRRAESGGFSILFLGLMFVMAYRQFVLDESIQEHADVAIVWLAAGVYTAVAAVTKGVNLTGEAKHRWVSAALTALAIMGVQVYNNVLYGVGLGAPIAWVSALLTFIVGFVFVLAVQSGLGYLYKRWERKNLG